MKVVLNPERKKISFDELVYGKMYEVADTELGHTGAIVTKIAAPSDEEGPDWTDNDTALFILSYPGEHDWTDSSWFAYEQAIKMQYHEVPSGFQVILTQS